MRIRALRVAFLLLVSSPLAAAGSGEPEGGPWYLQLGGGVSVPSDQDALGGPIEFEEGLALSALLGYQFEPCSDRLQLALELEAFFADFDVDGDLLLESGSSSGQDASVQAALLNGVLEWKWAQTIRFYVAAGAGLGYNVDFDTLADGPNQNDFDLEDDTAAVFQGKVGLRYSLGEVSNYSWSIGYRFLATEDLTFEDDFLGSSFDAPYEIGAFEVGFRWQL